MIPDAARGPLPGRLGTRLVMAVGLALTPLAVLAYLQAERVQAEARARAEVALLGQTQLAAGPLVDMIGTTKATVRALAAVMPALLGQNDACIATFRRVVEIEPGITFAGFVPIVGPVTCASTGQTHVLPDTPERRQLLAKPRPVMTVNPKGAVTGESVMIFSNPVTGSNGALLGFVSASVPHRALDYIPSISGDGNKSSTPEPLALITFTGEGTVLTAAYGMESLEHRLPRDIDLTSLTRQGAHTFSGRTPSGDARAFAVVPVAEGSLYVLSAWSPTVAMSGTLGGILPLWVFPFLMWLASLLVAWIAAEHQVLRHVRSLRRSIIAFAGGSRSVEPPGLDRAPNELRDVGEAYERLVESVLHDEAALEDMVHQKEVLLREVHHRVKNNLQLIASIMNIQMRKAFSPEAKLIVKGLHDRVMSLATVHRELYQTSGLTDVRADELLSTIVAQVLRMGVLPGRQILPETDFDAIRMTPDQSVPLSLVLTEALTNVLKHAGRDESGQVRLSVSLKRAGDGRATLRVANSVAQETAERTVPPSVDSTGLGAQLLAAFATQLSGDLAINSDPSGFSVVIEFPLKALSEAEHRFAET
ncbi:MAG: sensor histidine kinase [Paracoccaceae bacterium]|nr:MAG: sensor histidine kinase [Paracoccaceae bacterium]